MPDPKSTVYGVRDRQFVPLDANGFFIERAPYVPVASVSGAVRSSGGADWLGVVEAAAGAMLGGSGTPGVVESFSDGDESTPLDDAQPFKYTPDTLSDDVAELAARGVSEADEAECFAQYQEDLELCNAGRATYQSPACYIECSKRAFSRYQQCRGY